MADELLTFGFNASNSSVNDTGNETCGASPRSAADEPMVIGLVTFLYCTVFIMGLAGNCLVIYVIGRNRQMRSITNIFILNLAIADLIQICFSLWLTPIYVYMGHWVWGGATCQLLPLLQATGIFVSTFTLLTIAADRYIAICHPFRPRMSMTTCLTLIGGIWTLAVSFSLPYGINMSVRPTKCDPRIKICGESWTKDRHRLTYGYFVLTLQWLCPFMVISVCYVSIFLRLRKPSSLDKGRSLEKQDAENKRKARLTIMLTLMASFFGICWMPLNMLNIIRDHFVNIMSQNYWFIFWFLMSHVIGMSSTMWNPILYSWFNESFRTEFMKVIPCCPKQFHSSISRAGIEAKSTRHAPLLGDVDTCSPSVPRPTMEVTDIGSYENHATDRSDQKLLPDLEHGQDSAVVKNHFELAVVNANGDNDVIL